MAKGENGLWVNVSDLDVGRIKQILYGGSGTFTIAVPPGAIRQGSSHIILLSLRAGLVDHIGVATDVQRASDLERKLQIGPVRKLGVEVAVGDLFSSLPDHLRRHAKAPSGRVQVVPPKTWDALLNSAIKCGKLEKGHFKELRDVLISRADSPGASLREPVAFERDAFATAFEMLGGSHARKAYISSAPTQADAPFIQSLRHRDIQVIEDSMIQHDIVAFPGMERLVPSLVGAVKIFTYSGTLTVLNANRTSIERTLGVDLLYYNHTYQAFTFVQYKRMTGSKDPVYRPAQDANLGKEIKRMDDFESRCEVPSHSYDSYRLIDSPFFFKLCSVSVPGSWNGRMLPGMYFPLRLWKLLVASDRAQGPRGGLAVGYDQAPRRFSNSDFTRLLKQGWIGSSGRNTDRINSLLEQALSAGHSVIAASHQPDVKCMDYYRDDWGRFAEEEDESAI